jgi:hypothetical protein
MRFVGKGTLFSTGSGLKRTDFIINHISRYSLSCESRQHDAKLFSQQVVAFLLRRDLPLFALAIAGDDQLHSRDRDATIGRGHGHE